MYKYPDKELEDRINSLLDNYHFLDVQKELNRIHKERQLKRIKIATPEEHDDFMVIMFGENYKNEIKETHTEAYENRH